MIKCDLSAVVHNHVYLFVFMLFISLVILLAIKKFEDLVPALVNCFEESISMIRAVSVANAPLFDCSICTLQCVNLAVELFLDVMNKFLPRSAPLVALPDGGPDFAVSDILQLLKKLWEAFPIVQIHGATAKESERLFILNVEIAVTFLNLFKWIDDSSLLIERFLWFIGNVFLGEQVDGSFPPNKALMEKKICRILPFIPGLVSQVTGSWRPHLLKAFTFAFNVSEVDPQIILLYLSAMEEMLLPTRSCGMMLSNHPEMFGFQVEWLRELPRILVCHGDKHSNISNVILKLLMRIGQSSVPNSPLALEYDRLQWLLKGFYCNRGFEETVIYGPFIMLPTDCQELAVSIIYYFSSLSIELLESLAFCCLSPAMDALMVIRTIEVLHSAYRAGRVNISYHIGFLFTLIARSKVSPKWFSVEVKDGSFTNREVFRSLTRYVCLCLSNMGDNSLVLKLLFKAIFKELIMKPLLDNSHGMLKIIITLKIKCSILSDENLGSLSDWLAGYLIDASSYIQEEVDADVQSDLYRIFKYYVHPCVILFCRNDKLLFHVLELFASFMMDGSIPVQFHSSVNYPHDLSARVHTVSSILLLMYDEVIVHRSLYSSKDAIQMILQNIEIILDSNEFNMNFEEKHWLQDIFNKLKTKFKFQCLKL
ncbi:hypothetical protein AXF42_Ash007763 [Apostasia shenzhenica]|uniref:TEX10-like TPR repeats domain-containing protein n=1 Tax=Apostasia shenzhenica TaxID=1088818 RepID=A0A2I0B599_9ASPA|nr:hypothetical protein AXF42_Ash007763 [Apostasia shenzhenica]